MTATASKATKADVSAPISLSMDRVALSKALRIASHATSKRPIMPSLSCVKITTTENALHLVATNLDVAIQTTVPATVNGGGEIALPAQLLSSFVDAAAGDTVAIVVKAGSTSAAIESGRYSASLRGLPAGDFPTIPTVKNAPALTMPASVLKTLIEQTAAAAASDDSRPILTGVQIVFTGDAVTFAATDGFRMAIRTLPAYAPEAGLRLLVPAQLLRDVGKVLSGDETVGIGTDDKSNQVFFVTEHVTVIARLIEGAYPNVLSLVPKTFTTTAVIDRAALVKAVKAASLFSRDNSNAVQLELLGDTLTVQGSSAETGENVTELDVALNGDAAQIQFNARYVLDALSTIDAERVTLSLNSPNSPAVIRPTDDEAFTHLIMPMHTTR